MSKKSKPGPGKKLCPNCGEHVGVRTIECACGHRFRKKKKATAGSAGGARTEQPSTAQAAIVETLSLSNEQIATVLAAQELIRKCGGTNEAVRLIGSVGKSKL
jgi:hypothetical protein